MNNHTYLVIMAGGIGSRFWPFSRTGNPKQFQDIMGIGKTLLQMTYERYSSICPEENIYVVTYHEYTGVVARQLPQLDRSRILSEPFRRNTAPCMTYATYVISARDPDAICIVAPSDHVILNQKAFEQTLRTALAQASDQQKLITIGLKPRRAETGFGYIQYHESREATKKVKTFTEKPREVLARKFLESGDFVWNSGIFVWGVQAIKAELKVHLPELYEAFDEISQDILSDDRQEHIDKAYSHIKNISIDYGLMEKSSNVYMVMGDFDWSDMGSWDSLHNVADKNEDHNVVQGNALLYDTTDSLIKGPKDTLIVAHGLDNYLVTVCENVVLICRKGDENRFRDFVADVRRLKGKDYL